jgi:hypothetical protein
MRPSARFLATAIVVSGLSSGFLATASHSSAADDKGLRDEILKLAEAIEKGDDGSAQAGAIAKKNELEDVMGLFRLRTKKGLGIGPTPNAIKPDGIEAKIMNLGRKPLHSGELNAEAKELVRAAYITAAIAAIAKEKCPVDKKQGEKDPQSWKGWATDLQKASVELAKAAEAKKANDIKTAATKMNSSCNSCHGVFRD